MSGIIGGAGSKSGVIGTTELEYEEGEWTPNAAAGTKTTNNAVGTYVRVGNMVSVACYLNLTRTSGGSGGTALYGLPFIPTSPSATLPITWNIASARYFDANTPAFCEITVNTVTVRMRSSSHDETREIDWGTNTTIKFSCTYPTTEHIHA